MASNYVPKSSSRKSVGDAPNVLVSDVSLATTDTELSRAFETANSVLSRHDDAVSVLTETHNSIPRLLAERLKPGHDADPASNPATARDRLSQIDESLADARRRRRGAIQVLVEMEGGIKSAIRTLTEAKQTFAEGIVADFQNRYSMTIRALQDLWQEAARLSDDLRVPVPTEIPVRISTNPIRAGSLERVEGPPVAISTDPTVQQISTTFEKLERGLQTVSGVKTDSQRTRDLEARERINGTAKVDTDGVFEVTKTFTSQIGLLEFRPGDLVDDSLVGRGSLARLLVGRHIRRVTPGAVGVGATVSQGG